MNARDLILDTMNNGPVAGWGSYNRVFRFQEAGFEAFALRVRKLGPMKSSPLDQEWLDFFLGSTTALYGTLRIPYYGIQKSRFGQIQAEAALGTPCFSIVRWVEGETLENMKRRNEEDFAAALLAGIDQLHYTDLMKQVRLLTDMDYKIDAQDSNIMVNLDAKANEPVFTIIDVPYEDRSTYELSSILYRFPSHPTLREKLVTAAETAQLGMRGRWDKECTESWAKESDAFDRLSRIYYPQGPRPEPIPYPAELTALGSFTLDQSAADLCGWLRAIAATQVGRGIAF